MSWGALSAFRASSQLSWGRVCRALYPSHPAGPHRGGEGQWDLARTAHQMLPCRFLWKRNRPRSDSKNAKCAWEQRCLPVSGQPGALSPERALRVEGPLKRVSEIGNAWVSGSKGKLGEEEKRKIFIWGVGCLVCDPPPPLLAFQQRIHFLGGLGGWG